VAAGVSPDQGIVMLRILAGVLFLLLGLWSSAGNAQPQDQEPYQLSVNVDLVVLPATVRNRSGGFASDLREQDFQVYENGVRQSIKLFRHEDIPVTVGLVVDHSGSMQPKLSEVMAAAGTFVRSSNTEDEMFVVNFNEYVTIGLPGAIRFTNRVDELELAIRRASVSGQTALYDAVMEALDRLQDGSRDKKVLVVISDGGDNRSAHTLAEVLKRLEQSTVMVYPIGIFDEGDADRNPDVLRRLARATGGEAFFPEQLKDVVPICERIARDIRNQYTIGYVSNKAAQPGVYRSIRLVAAASGHGKLAVRTRAGYIAGPQ